MTVHGHNTIYILYIYTAGNTLFLIKWLECMKDIENHHIVVWPWTDNLTWRTHPIVADHYTETCYLKWWRWAEYYAYRKHATWNDDVELSIIHTGNMLLEMMTLSCFLSYMRYIYDEWRHWAEYDTYRSMLLEMTTLSWVRNISSSGLSPY